MSEELGQEPSEQVTPQEPAQQREYTAVEQKAMEMGWRPREEFDGEDENFVDAKEFVGRKPLFEKIDAATKAAKAAQKQTAAFAEHYAKVRETEYRRALNDIKAQKKQAMIDGDHDTFFALEEKQETMEEEKEQFAQEQQQLKVQDQPQVHPELAAWQARNPWYSTQPHMQKFADDVGARLQGAVRAGTMTPSQVLKEVENAVKEEFPQRFRNANKDKPSAVEGSGRKGSSASAAPNESSLSDQERQIMNTLVRGGHITKEKYLADLKAIKKEKS